MSSTFIALILGFIFGVCTMGCVLLLRKSDGKLRIDSSNPEKDVYRLELDSLDDLPKKKKIVLIVDKNAKL